MWPAPPNQSHPDTLLRLISRVRYLQTTANYACTHTVTCTIWIQSDSRSTGFNLSLSPLKPTLLKRKQKERWFFCGHRLVKWRFCHLIGTLYSVWPSPPTAHCDDRWQGGPLCSSDPPKPRATEWHLRQTPVLQKPTHHGWAAATGAERVMCRRLLKLK